MRIAILSRRPDSYSTQRLQQAAKARGHSVFLIDSRRCYMNISAKNSGLHYMGKILEPFDAVIPRISPTSTFYGAAVVRHLETMGTFSINPSIAITRARDKLRSLQLLAHKGVDMPITGFAHSESDINDLIQLVGGAPLIVKLVEGTQGVGVVLTETKKAAESVIQAFLGLKANIIVQEYIKESKGMDIRCFVLGDQVVAAMKRQGQAGEFRSNLHRGGTAESIEINQQERETAVKAAKILGLHLAGVDILRSNRGALVMEVNASPGLEGIESVTQKDIAEKIIHYIEIHAKPIKQGDRYEG